MMLNAARCCKMLQDASSMSKIVENLGHLGTLTNVGTSAMEAANLKSPFRTSSWDRNRHGNANMWNALKKDLAQKIMTLALKPWLEGKTMQPLSCYASAKQLFWIFPRAPWHKGALSKEKAPFTFQVFIAFSHRHFSALLTQHLRKFEQITTEELNTL